MVVENTAINTQPEPFRAGGRRNSRSGGWRSVTFRVEHRPKWWRRRPWLVEMDYYSDGFSDRGVVCSRHRSIVDANAAAAHQWANIEADHARIEACPSQHSRAEAPDA